MTTAGTILTFAVLALTTAACCLSPVGEGTLAISGAATTVSTSGTGATISGISTTTSAQTAGTTSGTAATGSTSTSTSSGGTTGAARSCDAGFAAPLYQLATFSTYGAIAVADFNRDGIDDLVIGTADGIGVVLGPLNGGNPILDSPVSVSAEGLVTADLDRDGFPDVIVFGQDLPAGDHAAFVLLGNGDGTFHAPQTLDAGLQAITPADFNQDGIPDLAVIDSVTFDTLWLRLGVGDGTFGPPTELATPALEAMITADFNRDGRPDLAFATGPSEGQLAILLNQTDGGFIAPATATLGPSGVGDMASADFNRDGATDLAIFDWSNTLWLLLGDGQGGFTPSILATFSESLIASAYGLVTGDFNGDGFVDLALGQDPGPGTVVLLLGNGDGTFQTAENLSFSERTYYLVAGAFGLEGGVGFASLNTNSPSGINVLRSNCP